MEDILHHRASGGAALLPCIASEHSRSKALRSSLRGPQWDLFSIQRAATPQTLIFKGFKPEIKRGQATLELVDLEP